MNPFLGKTLTELRDGVPGYSNPELDALAAKYCCKNTEQMNSGWWVVDGQWYHPTTDRHQAMRLQEKYWIHIRPIIPECPDEFTKPYWTIVYPNRVWRNAGSGGRHDNPRRAITETAVIAALTERIEEDGDD